MKAEGAITDVPGIRVGHAQDDEALTGCTVVLCEAGAVGGVDQRGGAPGTRETDLMRTSHLVQRVHAVLLAGGSAFGLEAATGVVRYLEERKVGFNVRVARVPIVPAAILFDLDVGKAGVRPDAEMGYRACLNASYGSAGPPAEGNAGAGTGASVGKILGLGQAMKGGLGTASIDVGNGLVVGAIVAVNAFGDVVDPDSGEIVAGARRADVGPLSIGAPGYFADTLHVMRSLVGRTTLAIARRGHTVIGVVATNARLNKEETNKVAQMAHDGLARAVRPAHTMLDGDTLFALATGKRRADVNIVGSFAAEAVARAILRAVRAARPVAGLPSAWTED
ncbi:MAG: P1 family peptidase [Anaerolineae bacterium]|jgi:L-aminopeptidase/D-esterase-like protein|nr:P1 family peptidase [Anaerolineae bacterium]